MFKFPRAIEQGQGQVLFNNKNKFKVGVTVEFFVSKTIFIKGDLGFWFDH